MISTNKVAVRTRSKGLGANQVFQTEVVPNATLSGELLYKRMAERLNISESMARINVETTEAFILDEIAQGNRIDFGLATFYPRLSGCISTRDADPLSEGIFVRGAVKARKALMEAPRKTVEPVNKLAHDLPRIASLVDKVTQSSTLIAPEHEIHIYGTNLLIDTSRSDEGIWLETRRKGQVVLAEILSTAADEAVCVFHGVIAPKSYTLVLGTRCGKGTNYKVRRCLWEVKVLKN